MWGTIRKGFLGICEEGAELREPGRRPSWTRVLANSNGYVRNPSTPPATPPEIRETRGGVSLWFFCFSLRDIWIIGNDWRTRQY